MPRFAKDASKHARRYLSLLYVQNCVEDYLAGMYMNVDQNPPTNALEQYQGAFYALVAVFGADAVRQMEEDIEAEVEPYRENYKQTAKRLFDQRWEARACLVS